MLRTVAVELCRLENNTENQDTSTPRDSGNMDAKGKDKSKDLENPSSLSKTEDKKETEEPKPRIVLTFRSEKPGVKSSTMKIVSPEEKNSTSPKKSRVNECDESENVESTSKSSGDLDDTTVISPKRSTRCRGKDSDIIASAIARKEKSYNEATPTTTATKRRIKPTEKLLSNKEYKLLTTQSNRVVTPLEKTNEGVQTRRSARRKSIDTTPKETPPKKQKTPAIEEKEQNKEVKRLNKLKRKHLSTLGLQEVDSENIDTVAEESVNDGKADEEVEAIDKDILVEEIEITESDFEQLDENPAAHTSEAESSDYEYVPKGRRAESNEDDVVLKKLRHRYQMHKDGDSCNENDGTENKRSSKRTKRPSSSSSVQDEVSDHETLEGAEGQLGVEPAKPDQLYGSCYCEKKSNVYMSEEEYKDPSYCGAIWSVGEMRVGCSSLSTSRVLRRSGPRAPYVLLCDNHRTMMSHHMCCPMCGLFCAQGSFYQCSKGHLFHLECGVGALAKANPGCPHCGMFDHWKPANRDCCIVRLDVNTKNKPIYLPEKRVDFTPAYLSFSKLEPPPTSPVLPPDLLPSCPVNLKELCSQLNGEDKVKYSDCEAVGRLKQAIVEFEEADKIISLIATTDINTICDAENGSYLVHVAASCGNLTAMYLLHYAGANIDAVDSQQMTPLIVAAQTYVDKMSNCEGIPKEPSPENKMDTDESEKDVKVDNSLKELEDKILKVIRYLVSAGCDVNSAGGEGETALHVAAGGGWCAGAEAVLRGGGGADLTDCGGWTPLVWAAERDHHRVLRLLVESGANPEALDSEGNAAIHWCCAKGASQALLVLLDANPLAQHALNANADTPLHVAAREGHYSCVVILLARGARTDVENAGHELPVEVCGGDCQTAISLNMQMELAIKDKLTQYKLLSSDISRGRESIPVTCVNEIDDAPLPSDFTYVTDYVTSSKINIDNTIGSMQGCSCSGACSSVSCACVVVGVRGWWSDGRLTSSFPYHDPPMLFQCNYTCHCDQRKCQNCTLARSKHSGSVLTRVEVFRTRQTGWGVRSKRAVMKGSPVMRYCGEVVTSNGADLRNDDHYTFSMDIKDDLLEQCAEKEQLCVDACKFGGAARFVNHSCTPNLAPVRVFTTTRDLRAPDITLFALRDIKPNEELTFDYGDKFWSVKNKHMKCDCDSPGCRYPAVAENEST